MSTDESLDERIRAGLAAEVSRAPAPPVVEDQLACVLHRRRRRRQARIALGVAAVIAVIAGPWAAIDVLRTPGPEPRPAGPGGLAGTYRVEVSGRGATAALSGTWTVVLAPGGQVDLRPPAGVAGPIRPGSSYQVHAGVLRTNAFLDWPGCQRTSSSIGSYDVARTGDAVTFTVISDSCSARLALFDGSWVRSP